MTVMSLHQGRYAFESCLTLTSITFARDHTNKPRALPEGAFCGAGIEQLCLPGDFHNIGPRACENCKGLVEVNLTCTEITALLHSTFAHCVALNCLWLPPQLRKLAKKFSVELLPAEGPDSDACCRHQIDADITSVLVKRHCRCGRQSERSCSRCLGQTMEVANMQSFRKQKNTQTTRRRVAKATHLMKESKLLEGGNCVRRLLLDRPPATKGGGGGGGLM